MSNMLIWGSYPDMGQAETEQGNHFKHFPFQAQVQQ